MLVIIRFDEDEVAHYAYEFMRRKLEGCQKFVLGLAAGATPLGLYRKMVEGYHRRELDFSNVHTFNLDECVGLGPDDLQSYCCFLRTHLCDLVNLEKNIHFLSVDMCLAGSMIHLKKLSGSVDSARYMEGPFEGPNQAL